jgi:hypothetical protein
MGFESDGLLTYKNVETRLVQKAHRQLNG